MRFITQAGFFVSLVTGFSGVMAGEVPKVDYQVVHVQIAGGGADEKGTIMLEKQTGRSWLLVQRGGAQPAWQALPFEPGFDLNQQTLPPDVSRIYHRLERDKGG